MALPRTIVELFKKANLTPGEKLEYEIRVEKILEKVHRHGVKEGYARGVEEAENFLDIEVTKDLNEPN